MAQNPLAEEQADLIREINRSAKAGTIAQILERMEKLDPVARQVMAKELREQRAQLKQQEQQPPGSKKEESTVQAFVLTF